MGSFCVKRKEGRGTENRGRKALHETLEEMAERNQWKEEAHETRESLPAPQDQGVRLGRPDKLLRSVPCHASGPRLEKQT